MHMDAHSKHVSFPSAVTSGTFVAEVLVVVLEDTVLVVLDAVVEVLDVLDVVTVLDVWQKFLKLTNKLVLQFNPTYCASEPPQVPCPMKSKDTIPSRQVCVTSKAHLYGGRLFSSFLNFGVLKNWQTAKVYTLCSQGALVVLVVVTVTVVDVITSGDIRSAWRLTLHFSSTSGPSPVAFPGFVKFWGSGGGSYWRDYWQGVYIQVSRLSHHQDCHFHSGSHNLHY